MRIDEEVAAVINQNKEDFYNKYDYLKPDAEKNFLEICFDSAATLNIAGTWGNIDNPIFNTLQSVFNWTSTISNGLYNIGMLYNTVKYKFGSSFNRRSKGASGAEYQYNMVENPGSLVDIDANAARTFRSGKYNVNVLEGNTVYYRAGDSKSPLGQTPLLRLLQSSADFLEAVAAPAGNNDRSL